MSNCGRVKEKFGLRRIKGLSDDFTSVEKGIRETRKTMKAREGLPNRTLS